MVDWMFSSPPILLEAEVTPVISKFVLDACGTSASRQRLSWPAAVHGGLVQLVVLVGFDETLKQFDAGSQFSPALCVRRALGFVKDSHVRHTWEYVYAIADGRFDGVNLMMQCQVGTGPLTKRKKSYV